MRLTDDPTDAALTSGRKRSIRDLEAPPKPNNQSKRPIDGQMHVDQDLLVQVLRARLLGMIGDLRGFLAAGNGGDMQREAALLRELEALVDNLEQDWVVALLSSSKPQYGFPDVLQALKARIKTAEARRVE